MGYYIEVPERFNKAQQLIDLYGARMLDKAPNWEDIDESEAIICVIQNANFDAAGFAYSPQELEYFKHPDGRHRIWLLMDKELVHKLTGYEEYNS